MSVDVAVADANLVVTLHGFDRVWALRKQLVVPLAHVKAATVDPTIARGWIKGLRWPGTHLPGVITAGTFYQEGERNFWFVRNPNNVVVIDLDYEYFAHLIIEVDDPRTAVHLIHRAATS